ncbi:exosome complex component CSL4-like [Zophobas morio]|uniref:exosome complex component CSL4-like n=1 Tax=Zophobas morio TaxID=2755281 RepID=UPI0030827E3F
MLREGIDCEQFVIPGEKVADLKNFQCGSNTYLRGNFIYSSIVGIKNISKESKEGKKIVSVVQRNPYTAVIPEVGSFVYARVISVNPRFCKCAIICVNSLPLQHDYTGIIRVRDVRATEPDKVEIYNSFRPGDIVRAEVISLGDSRSYYLSTAKNELGVIYAKSMAGEMMIPINWCEMQCPKTKVKEFRKTAKPSISEKN